MIAEGALVSNMLDRMEEADPVRATHDAVAAADTPGAVNQNDTVCSLISRSDRTDLNAGRGFAVVAELGHEKSLGNFIFRDQCHP